jgi:hypothetical protein
MDSISCPKCASHDWKSAKLIVLEGTTQTVGDIEGGGATPSKFSGGLTNFLLADAWFSRKFSLQFDVGLTTTTALVEEIKVLLTAEAVKIRAPVEPTPPKILSFWARIEPAKKRANRARIPKKPNPPRKPIEPKTQEFLDEGLDAETSIKTLANFVFTISMVALIIAIIFLESASTPYSIKSFEDFYGLPNMLSVHIDLIPSYFVVLLLILVLCFPIGFLLKPLSKRLRLAKKARKQHREAIFNGNYEKYQNDLKHHEETMRQFNEIKLPNYEEELEQIKKIDKIEEDRQKYDHQKALIVHKQMLEIEETSKRNYEKKMGDYSVAYRHYENQKLALWENATICMRCGLAFMKQHT